MPKKEEVSGEKSREIISKKLYGQVGADSVFQFTLSNAQGMKVNIMNYGGIVTDLIMADRNGEAGNVVLGYDSLSGYLQPGNPYFGCLVGRYANRIAGAKFSLDGKEYTLAPNNNGNTLHGGNKGFDKVTWNVKSYNDSMLLLSYTSRDGEEGYPGNLTVEVTYSVGADNSLRIAYHAMTDKPTPVNLTNHCYFNLSSGKDSTILGHDLVLNADQYTPVNEQLIPTGSLDPVKGSAMDFTLAKKVGRDISEVAGGYDHNWVLNKAGSSPELAGSLYDAGSGRYMEVFTTEPGIQFYSGNFLNGSLLHTRGGSKYGKHAGLCLETQHFPDSPNQPGFPGTILKPGTHYHQETFYKFSVK